MSEQFVVHDLPTSTRLDRLLRSRFPTWGRQAVGKLIAGRQVTVNGQPVWLASWQVDNGDRIEITQPPAARPEQPAAFDDVWLIAIEPDLIVADKPAGLLSEPTRGEDRRANLRDLAIARFGPLTLVHRLDRDTSGVVILARSAAANRELAQAFRAHTIVKEYVAIVAAPNRLADSGVIDAFVGPHPSRQDRMNVVAKGGQRAVTRYAVVTEAPGLQQVCLWPETGRTHQLRVHLASMGAPILGDRLYGDAGSASRLMLHAHRITLPPLNDMPPRTFAAALPAVFLQF